MAPTMAPATTLLHTPPPLLSKVPPLLNLRPPPQRLTCCPEKNHCDVKQACAACAADLMPCTLSSQLMPMHVHVSFIEATSCASAARSWRHRGRATPCTPASPAASRSAPTVPSGACTSSLLSLHTGGPLLCQPGVGLHGSSSLSKSQLLLRSIVSKQQSALQAPPPCHRTQAYMCYTECTLSNG